MQVRLSPLILLILAISSFAALADSSPYRTGAHRQTVRDFYSSRDGLPAESVSSIAVSRSAVVRAAAAGKISRKDEARWVVESGPSSAALLFTPPSGPECLAGAGDGIWSLQGGTWKLAPGSPPNVIDFTAGPDDTVWALAPAGLWRLDNAWRLARPLDSDIRSPRSLCSLGGERIYVAGANGLFGLMGKRTYWLGVEVGPTALPSEDVRAVSRLGAGHIIAATGAGLALSNGLHWRHFKGTDGLPIEELTRAAVGPEGTVWLGSDKGIVRWRNGEFTYLAGGRWLPDNRILALTPAADGSIWAATPGGIAHIYEREMTLPEKAAHYQRTIDSRNRRHGYVTVMQLPKPGSFEGAVQEVSDNDGTWTALYVAAQSFQYAATKSAEARARASRSMKALLRLESITGIKGFPARAIVHPDEPQFDKRSQRSHPEWHPSPVEQGWYWKGDTSSDELDGHYFAWYIHHELAATEEEKKAIRGTCKRVTDHILDNGYYLIDKDGKPTTWGVWAPEKLNGDPMWWEERGLNSLEILSHLKVAHHLVGDARYDKVYRDLIANHQYALNAIHTKIIGGVSHDDELAFLAYYPLMQIEKDPALRGIYLAGLKRLWEVERVEENPFWNFVYSTSTGEPSDIEEAVKSLREIPLDLIDWKMENSHRADLRFNPPLKNGERLIVKPLPWTERPIHKWDSNPYTLDRGNGLGEEDPTLWLLPYWMARHHRLID